MQTPHQKHGKLSNHQKSQLKGKLIIFKILFTLISILSIKIKMNHKLALKDSHLNIVK